MPAPRMICNSKLPVYQPRRQHAYQLKNLANFSSAPHEKIENLMSLPVSDYNPFSAASSSVQLMSLLVATLLLAGCTSLGASGPNVGRVLGTAETEILGTAVQVIDVNSAVAERAALFVQERGFAETLGESPPVGTIVGPGDLVGVTVWEAPPAALFGMLNSTLVTGPANISTGHKSEIAPQMVDSDGKITLPFVGTISVAGRTPREVEQMVRSRLEGVANQPQVLVTITANSSANVTVVGEVTTSARVPLTARGERLLDVIAAVGGVKQEIDKVTVQVTRGETVASMPLERLVRNPRDNVRLRPDDVVAAYFEPFSFISLGATGLNAEIPFQASGITLAQGLGRISGLQDNRANPRGVFLFRWESPEALAETTSLAVDGSRPGPGEAVPVIYRVDLSDPATFFAAQSFPIRNRDILYVSNAPGVDLQRFVMVLSQGAFSVIGITNEIAP